MLLVKLQRCLLGLLFVLMLANSAHSQSKPFPFVFEIEDTSSPASFAGLNSTPAGSDGFVKVKDGHFATDNERVRFWGVNFCFGANFPTHAEAEKVAQRLQHLGINAVRIHHHETQFSPNGLFKENGTIDPQQMDKLDYLFAELNKRGIYVNINLHVGRSIVREKGLPELSTRYSASGDKHALFFMPEVQDGFWDYCREYLGHVNPYRKMARNRDPGIAMIEILNENRFSREGPRYLAAAPEPYRSRILKLWNDWLKAKYQTDEGVRQAWKSAGTSLGKPIVDSRSFRGAGKSGSAGGKWLVQDNQGSAPLRFKAGNNQIRIEPQSVAEEQWQQQLAVEGLSLKKGERYFFKFDIRSDSEKTINFNAATLEGGWRSMGLGDQVVAKSEWQTVQRNFIAADDCDGNARLAFDFGGDLVPLEFRNVRLQSGASWVDLPEGQSLAAGDVSLPGELSSPLAKEAAVEFMQGLERTFYGKTINLIRNELGMKIPICPTQVNYVGAKMAAELGDFTDLHSYWNHPLFPGKDWDMSDWRVTHEPIESDPYSNSWPRNSPLMRSAWRVHGKPFTYSEWNTGEPSLPAAGGVPVMSLMGSLQDWDAVFFFDYEDQGGRWDTNRLDGFFRMNSQPCKLALLGPFGHLYRSGQLAAMQQVHSSAEGDHLADGVHAFSKLVGLDSKLDRVMGNSPPASGALAKEYPPLLKTADGSAEWDARNAEKALVMVNTPETKAVWGLVGGQTVAIGDWQLKFGELPGDYGVFVATSKDGKPLSESKSILISAVNHVENSTMEWNERKDSLGEDWGEGPTVTWGVPVEITFPHSSSVQAKSLTATGTPGAAVSVSKTPGGFQQIVLSPDSKALSYSLTAE